jgi:hypothetical protein
MKDYLKKNILFLCLIAFSCTDRGDSFKPVMISSSKEELQLTIALKDTSNLKMLKWGVMCSNTEGVPAPKDCFTLITFYSEKPFFLLDTALLKKTNINISPFLRNSIPSFIQTEVKEMLKEGNFKYFMHNPDMVKSNSIYHSTVFYREGWYLLIVQEKK